MGTNNVAILPSTTAVMSRLQIFEPTRKPKYAKDITHDDFGNELMEKVTRVVNDSERVVINNYGEAKISGRLGQAHANLLEAIMWNVTDILSVDDNSMTVIVDPYKVRLCVGGGKKYNVAELDVIVKELLAVVVDIKAPGLRVRGHLIDTIVDDNEAVINPCCKIKEDKKFRSLWKVTIGAAYLAILKRDKIKINRDPTLIASLKNGVSQAIVRLCMTHSNTPNGGWKLDGLIEDVGAIAVDEHGKYDSTTMRNRRREIKKDAADMIKCGVVVDEGRVFLEKKSIGKGSV